MPHSSCNLYHTASGAVLERWDSIVEALQQEMNTSFSLEVFSVSVFLFSDGLGVHTQLQSAICK
jgi:hypothetical protein